MGNFNHPDICWVSNNVRHAWSRRFLQRVENNFLMQVTEEPARRVVLLDLVLTNKKGLAGDVKVSDSLGCSGHPNGEMVKFMNLCGRSKAMSKIAAMDFRRYGFDLFKDLFVGISRVRVLKGKGADQHLNISSFKYSTSACLRV